MKKILFLITLSVLILSGCAATRPTKKKPGAPAEKISFKARDYYLKGLFLQMEERYSDALVQFHKAELFDTTSATIYNSLAENYLKLGELEPALHHLKQALKRDRHNTETYRLLGELYFRDQKDQQAIEAYRALLKLDPYNEQARNFLLFLYEKNKMVAEKAELYRQMLGLYGKSKSVLKKIADIYTRQKDYKNAVHYLNQITKIDSSDAQIYAYRAQLYEVLGKADSAMISFKKAIRLDPGNKDYLNRLATLYRSNQRYKDIITLFEPVLDRDSTDVVARLSLAEAQYLLENTTAVKRLLQPLADDSTTSWGVYDLLGRIALEEKDHERAVRYFRRITRLEPKNRFGWLFLGFAYADMDNQRAAAEAYAAGTRVLPEDGGLWSWLGVALQQQNKNKEAIAAFLNALRYDPSNINALSSLPVIYESEGNFKGSDSVYTVALKRLPDNALLLNNFAYSLSERNLRLKEAEQMARKALEKEPDNSSYLDTMGWIYFKLGDYARAEKYILRAIEKGEASAVVLEHMGDIYVKLNKPQKAREYYMKALELDPENKQVRDKLANQN